MKLTPLNIITSACLVLGCYRLMIPSPQLPVQSGLNGVLTALCFMSAFIAFISDLIFRKFIPLLRNIWVVECAFIIFTLCLIIIFRMLVA